MHGRVNGPGASDGKETEYDTEKESPVTDGTKREEKRKRRRVL